MSDRPPPVRDDAPSTSRFTRRSFVAAGVVAAFIVLLAFFDAIASVLLVVFAGVLLAVFLGGLARRVSRHTPLAYGWSLGLVITLLVVAFGLLGWFLAPKIASQSSEIAATVPASLQQVRESVTQYRWGEALFDEVPAPREWAGGIKDVWGRVTGVASTVVSVFGTVVLILTIGIYGAANPSVYRRGVVLLVPPPHRGRAGDVLDATTDALWGWLIGQFISMTLVGVLVGVGLLLIGVPLALTLGLLSGLLEFVPLLGPWLGAIPGVLIALTVSPTTALYAALMYLAIQQVESNVITPLVMKKAVQIPPALTVAAALIGGALFGLVGVFLATPLAVVAMVLVRMLYVHDLLGDTDVEPRP